MAHIHASTSTRLVIVIALSSAFFVAELVVSFRTHSLALFADAFHYLNDLITFVIALIALRLSKSGTAPDTLTFGWQRAEVLGAFFNGAFLMALGLSICCQSIERFVNLQRIDRPELVLVVGCVGLTINIVCILVVHEHHHHHHHAPKTLSETSVTLLEEGPKETSEMQKNLGLNAVVIHIFGDVINNLGVIAAALIMWRTNSPKRYYADPAFGIAIAVVITCSAVPLAIRSGRILLGSTPPSAQQKAVMQALKKVPGVISVHDLYVWQLSQEESIASAHIVMSPLVSRNPSEEELEMLTDEQRMVELDDTVNERLARLGRCLHEFGVYKLTLQIEDASEHSILEARIEA